MSLNIRYRLIQILEIPLWLGAVAGIGMVTRDAWALREQGASAMLDAAGPALLAIGAAMAALIVLIGIYHNSRRSAEAMDRLSRQGNGGMRRLPGAQRHDTYVQPAQMPAPAPVPVAVPTPAAVQAPVMTAPTPAPVPVTAPTVAAPVAVAAAAPAAAPAPVFSTPVMADPLPEPAPVTPHIVASAPEPQSAPVSARAAEPLRPMMRAGLRRLGPAN